jgi:flagellar biosynthesis/type III secretory pathway M-ring protein FliF/YscJ
MSALLAVAPAIPLGQSGKFVAGAYIVFLVLILVYVAIMALRSQRIERELSQLQRDVEAARNDSPSGAERSEPQREQEPVL